MAKRDKKWLVSLLCLGGTILFWFLHTLGKEHTAEIDYPVTFVVDETKMKFSDAPPASMRLQVTGCGWSLLKHLLQRNAAPVKLHVAQLAKRGCIKREQLRNQFDRELVGLKVDNVLMEEPISLHVFPK